MGNAVNEGATMSVNKGRLFGLLATLLAILIAGSSPAMAKRVALVIGNSAYKNTVALPNPVNDAKAITTKLRDLGFEVVSGLDQDYVGMRRSVADFAKTARGAEIALLFYAGHGIQVRGQNYLIPTDAKFEDETSLDFETMPVDFILSQMSNDVKVQMVFLDACRNNPLARSLASRMAPSRSVTVGVGLAEIKLQETGGEGSVIAFATSPGDVALDGEGQNSPFTSALLRHIDEPDASIQTVMTRVTGDVYRETGQRQRPWVNASLIGEVYLNKQVASLGGTSSGAAAATSAAPDLAASAPVAANHNATIAWEREKMIWETAQKGNTVADYQSYLSAYPNGNFADFARNAMERLKSSDQVASIGGAAGMMASQPMADVKAIPGTPDTEAMMGWNRDDRREAQTRLNLSGNDIGRPDGAFGNNTRSGIMAWQSANGFVPTGFFTAGQYALLTQQTNVEYTALLEQQRRNEAAAATRSARRSSSDQPVGRVQNKNRNRDGDVAGAAFFGGLVGGVIGGAIGR